LTEETVASEPTRENPCGPIGTEILFENDQVRVWDMQVPPGGKIELENVQGHSFIADDKVGGVIWRDAGEKHELRNLSGKPYQNILVELKKPAK